LIVEHELAGVQGMNPSFLGALRSLGELPDGDDLQEEIEAQHSAHPVRDG
jgi:hypothetical protein